MDETEMVSGGLLEVGDFGSGGGGGGDAAGSLGHTSVV